MDMGVLLLSGRCGLRTFWGDEDVFFLLVAMALAHLFSSCLYWRQVDWCCTAFVTFFSRT